MPRPSISKDLRYFFLNPNHPRADEIRAELCRKHAEARPNNICSITESASGPPTELIKVEGADPTWFEGFFTTPRRAALRRIPLTRGSHFIFVRDEFYTPLWTADELPVQAVPLRATVATLWQRFKAWVLSL